MAQEIDGAIGKVGEDTVNAGVEIEQLQHMLEIIRIIGNQAGIIGAAMAAEESLIID